MGEPQLLGIVARQGDHHRAFVTKTDGDTGRPLELDGEVRPQALALPCERQQPLLRRLGFDLRRQHSGGGPTRLAPTSPGFEHGDGETLLTEAPGDRQSDHPTADNGDSRGRYTGLGDIEHETPRLPSLV